MKNRILNLKGPIFILGAGGFIGKNMLDTCLKYRNDVYGIVSSTKDNYRLNNTPKNHIVVCDITDIRAIKKTINAYNPQTIFNFAAYGAYSKQQDVAHIHSVNYLGNIHLLETLKETTFSAYVYAGSSSEYGLNASAPKEQDELIPNSQYAVSKAAACMTNIFYGKALNLPVGHMRLYAVYGPWEEQDRLIPTLIRSCLQRKFPPLVNPQISRDFIYVSDVLLAFIEYALLLQNGKLYGNVYNIGTGIKTTMKDLANMAKKLFNISEKPIFGTMENRKWDVLDWYSNPFHAKTDLGFVYKIKLEEGLIITSEWQKKYA